MRNVFILLILLAGAVSFADDTSLIDEYNLLLEDLGNIDTVGYKSKSADSINFNMDQASIIISPNYMDFSISGNGFFKVYDEKTKAELYTRTGSLQINVEGLLVNSDGYKIIPEFVINPKKIDKLSFSDNKLIFKDGKNSIEYPFMLFLPKGGTNIKRSKNYFQFENAAPTTGFKLTNKSLETSNTNLTSSLLRMIFILNSLDKIGSKKVKEVKLKISFIEKLLDTVNQWQISVNQETVILEIKQMFTKTELEKSRGLLLMKKIINDYMPFIVPDYE